MSNITKKASFVQAGLNILPFFVLALFYSRDGGGARAHNTSHIILFKPTVDLNNKALFGESHKKGPALHFRFEFSSHLFSCSFVSRTEVSARFFFYGWMKIAGLAESL